MPHGPFPKPSTRAAEPEPFPRLDEPTARRLSERLRETLIARGRSRAVREAPRAPAEAKAKAEALAKTEALRKAEALALAAAARTAAKAKVEAATKAIAEAQLKAAKARRVEAEVDALRARVTAGHEAQEQLARLGYCEPPVVMSYALLAEELTSRRIYNQSGRAFNRVAVRKAVRLGTRFFAGLRDFCVEGGVEFAAATRFLDRLAETRAPRASRGAVADVVHTRAATGRRALA